MDVHPLNRQDVDGKQKESEEKFSKIFKIAPYVNVLSSVKDGKFIDVNDMFSQTLGFTREEALAGSSLSLNIWVNPEDRKEVVSSLLEGKDVRNKVCRYRKKNGEIITGIYSGAMVIIDRESCILSSIQDITELKNTEERLKAQTEAMEVSVDGMAILSPDQTYRYTNMAHCKIYGYDNPRELIGASWRILYEQEELLRFDKEIMPKLKENGHYQGRATGKKKDGSTFPQSLSLSTLKDGGLICVVRDITEIIQAENTIRESEQWYHSMMNASPDAITITDLEGRVLMVSPVGVTMFGCTEEKEIIGHMISDFISSEDKERAMVNFGHMLQGTLTGLNEFHGQRVDGSTFYTEVNGELIKDAEGKIKNLIFIVRDITERKKKSEELEKMNALMVGRELKMAELKKDIDRLNNLIKKLGGNTE
jgi:PAS domain S-box-containing protein